MRHPSRPILCTCSTHPLGIQYRCSPISATIRCPSSSHPLPILSPCSGQWPPANWNPVPSQQTLTACKPQAIQHGVQICPSNAHFARFTSHSVPNKHPSCSDDTGTTPNEITFVPNSVPRQCPFNTRSETVPFPSNPNQDLPWIDPVPLQQTSSAQSALASQCESKIQSAKPLSKEKSNEQPVGIKAP